MSSKTPEVSTLMSLAANTSLIGRMLVILTSVGEEGLYVPGSTLRGKIEEISIIDKQASNTLLGIRVERLEVRNLEDVKHSTWVQVPGGEHKLFTIDDRLASASYLRSGIVRINDSSRQGTIELP